MIASLSLLLALAAAPQQAPAEPATGPAEVVQTPAPEPGTAAAAHSDNPVVEAQARAPEVLDPHGAEAGHGEEKGIDFLHHILDSREIEFFDKALHLPPAGTWVVGGIDFTPTKHLVMLVIAALLTILVVMSGAAGAKRAQAGRTAGKRHNAIEATVLYLRNEVVKPNVGHNTDRFAPFVVTLFFFILFCNLLGLIPFGSTATANVSVTGALAIMSFIAVEVGGMRALGAKGYLGTIFFVPKGMNPVAGWIMAIALAPVELLGKFTKPFSLAIRLMANMTAGHIVLLALISLIFVFGLGLAFAPVLMGVAIFFLEIFVAFLQAFIFAMLTSVFIGLMQHAH